MLKEILIIGIGGEGVQSIGKHIVKVALNENYRVSFYPIYGSQMRGGESTVVIKISDSDIVNPVLSNPDIVVIINDAHVNKYNKYINTTYNMKIIDLHNERKIKNKNNIALTKIMKELGITNNESK